MWEGRVGGYAYALPTRGIELDLFKGNSMVVVHKSRSSRLPEKSKRKACGRGGKGKLVAWCPASRGQQSSIYTRLVIQISLGTVWPRFDSQKPTTHLHF